MKKQERHDESQEQLLERLLHLVHRRSDVPADISDRVRMVVKNQWKEQVRRRARFRGLYVLSFAAVIAGLLLFAARYAEDFGLPAQAPVAVVEAVQGKVTLFSDASSAPANLKAGDILYSRSDIFSNQSSRILIRVPGGATLRLDKNTRIHWKDAESLFLKNGAVYFDSAGKSNTRLRVETGYGSIQHIGTQFETRIDAEVVRLRVREGSAKMSGSVNQTAKAGIELAVRTAGQFTRRAILPYGPEWAWITEITPPYALEGKRLREFLSWIARENGWSVRFVSTDLLQKKSPTILHGSLHSLTPLQMLDSVLPVCGLKYQLQNGVVLISSK